MFILIDGQNNDIVVKATTMLEVQRAARKYDDECEGDWFPRLKRKTDEGKYEEVFNWSY